MSNFLVATVDYIPNRKYEILDVVFGNRIVSIFSKTEASKAVKKMIEDAQQMGADGVIGIRINTSPNGSTTVIGTAIKFID